MQCPNCGAEINENYATCPECLTPIVHSQSPRASFTRTAANILLSEGEEHIRKYHCASLSFPRCDGYVNVTNKRVIFNGSANGKGRVIDEVKIDTISAISSMYGAKIRIPLLIVGAILVIVSFVMIKSGFLPFLAFFVVGGLCLYFSYRKIFALQIFSSGASGAPIAVGEGMANNPFSSKGTASVIAKPSTDTDKMMLEIGALVSDLQTMGDLAIAKWK